jgi:hypothetical protein
MAFGHTDVAISYKETNTIFKIKVTKNKIGRTLCPLGFSKHHKKLLMYTLYFVVELKLL